MIENNILVAYSIGVIISSLIIIYMYFRLNR